jgi:hypothetical protein
MCDPQHITAKPLRGITTEQACDARARAWAYVFDCFNHRNEQEGGPAAAPKDDVKGSNGYVASKNHTK